MSISSLKLCGVLVIIFLQGPVAAQYSNRPFPQHCRYFTGVIVPDHITRAAMDKQVIAFYKEWKAQFVRKDPTGNYYIWTEGSAGKHKCVSEGQGYGMIITVLMAGVDTSAKRVYDGMLKYCRAHHSTRSNYLMAWAQDKSFRNVDGSTATDGDLDITYSLFLADIQWGSKDGIDYKAEGLAMLRDILSQEVNPITNSILLGNSVEADSKDYYDMRSSDFMPAHFKTFAAVSHDERWSKIRADNYKLFHQVQDRYSPDAGLLPDFILHINKHASPPTGRYLESRYDGLYNYNACRVPWRIATDFIVNGDLRARTFVQKINKWLRETTGNNPDNISAGYTLAGDDLKTRNFEALSFINSFAVSAMVDKGNQQWLNHLWNYIMNFRLADFDYYDNSIKMITTIIISGNYWTMP